MCREDYLERVIASKIPEITSVKIHKALERLRAMMCPRTNMVHVIVKKFNEYYVLDDAFYYILEQIGNPYQALRVELMIRAMSGKYNEIEKRLDENMAQFHEELPKADMMNKFIKAQEKKKTDYLAYLIEKSRKLPVKFNPKFPENKIPPIYEEWKAKLNELVELKLKFIEIDKKMDQLRAYYSGAKQIMSYMEFIDKTTFDDEISEKVKDLLVKARNELKFVNEKLDTYDKKALRLLNLDLEKYILEHGLDEAEAEESD